jgi:hypothetical protein
VVWLTDLGQRMALKIQKNSKPPAVPSWNIIKNVSPESP